MISRAESYKRSGDPILLLTARSFRPSSGQVEGRCQCGRVRMTEAFWQEVMESDYAISFAYGFVILNSSSKLIVVNFTRLPRIFRDR